MKHSISSIFIILIYIIGFCVYGLGVFHSFKKHDLNDAMIGTVAFPWAMYRGVEFFWHDDFSDVNWKKRLPNDMRTCVYFLNQGIINNSNQYQFNEDLEKFSSKIKDYPNDKKKFLTDGSRKYIHYIQSLTNDVISSFNKYFLTSNFEITFSKNTIELEKQLSKYNLKEDVQLTKRAYLELDKQLKERFPSDTTGVNLKQLKEYYDSNIKLSLEKRNSFFKLTFRNLFEAEF